MRFWINLSIDSHSETSPGLHCATHIRHLLVTCVTFLELRHTFGTRLAEAGFSEATIADLMGHADPQITRRYTHATDRAKRAAVEAVRVSGERFCHNPATKQERPPLMVAVSV